MGWIILGLVGSGLGLLLVLTLVTHRGRRGSGSAPHAAEVGPLCRGYDYADLLSKPHVVRWVGASNRS
jgi:hypothetical protein